MPTAWSAPRRPLALTTRRSHEGIPLVGAQGIRPVATHHTAPVLITPEGAGGGDVQDLLDLLGKTQGQGGDAFFEFLRRGSGCGRTEPRARADRGREEGGA